MKADKYGTWTEQVRHGQEWIPGNSGPRCESCAYLVILNRDSSKARCSKGAFATALTASCAKYQPSRVHEVTA